MFLITTDELEERVNTVEDSEEDKLSSEESEPSSVGDLEEEETDPRVQEEVGEIVKAFSTMAVGNES